MVNWELYETLLGLGSTSDKRSITIDEAVNSFVSGMVDDPAYQKDALINGENTPILASRTSKYQCSIKATPDTKIHIGDLVECLGATWLVMDLFADKVGLINGEMWLCNHVLKFHNNTPDIISAPCVVDNESYRKSNSNDDVRVPLNTYEIHMSMNDDTRRMYIDKRLSLGVIFSASGEEVLEVYKITGINVKSNNFGEGSHLMSLTVQRDVFDPKVDSLVHEVCDHVLPDDSVIYPKPSGQCTLTGRDTIRIGSRRKYTAQFIDYAGKELDDVPAGFDVTAPDAIKYDITGNELTIDVPLDEDLIGSTIIISVFDIDRLYGSFEKKVQVITLG